MQSLQEQASQKSGVPLDEAFQVDAVNLYERLGHQVFIDLSTNFYTRVYDDKETWFRDIFANSTREHATQNQYEFFIQRLGGPPLYSQRKGHPALIGRHGPYAVTERAAQRWLEHMDEALDETAGIDEDSRQRLRNFFRHTAYFLVAGKELVNRNRLVGYGGKHTGGA
ncbi:hemoglobin-like protein [Klebsormidium nitens]|uniref:Hemoglobin-like protein n=1 Tax=Klebsormidium nitens TaxID=105231 RepID=A0A0U9HKG8_KLENI|nr:hemoglobin-like protein [Klebsormidium nitens]|eukprot:GAQ77952.1 hemoglobin-like protein [Klebsormidium nitens]